MSWLLPCLLLCVSLFAPPAATAQTMDISAGVRTYASLSGATVTMTGKSGLRLTARVRRERAGVTLIPKGATTLDGLGLPAAAAAVVPLGVPVAEGDFDVLPYVLTTPVEDSPTRGAFMRLRAVLQ